MYWLLFIAFLIGLGILLYFTVFKKKGGGDSGVCTPRSLTTVSQFSLRSGPIGPIPIVYSKERSIATKRTIQQVMSSNAMRDIRTSIPPTSGSSGPFTLPLTRVSGGNYVFGIIVSFGLYDSKSQNTVIIHSLLDTGSYDLVVIGSQCKSRYCGSDYGVWPSDAPSKLPNTCTSTSYGSGTFIGEYSNSPFITKNNNAVPVNFQVVEDVSVLRGMPEWPSFLGVLPNAGGQTKSFINSLLSNITGIENGYTIDLKQNNIIFGQIDKTGTPTTMQPFPGNSYNYFVVRVVSSSFTPDGGQPENIGFSGAAILDTGSTGISMTAAKNTSNGRKGTFSFALDNGVILKGNTDPSAIGPDPFGEDHPIGLIGICCMLESIFGFDLDNHIAYIKQ